MSNNLNNPDTKRMLDKARQETPQPGQKEGEVLCLITFKVMMQPRVQQSLYLKPDVAEELVTNLQNLLETAITVSKNR